MKALVPRGSGIALAASLFLAGEAWLFQPALIYEGNAPILRYGLAQLGLVLVPGFALTCALLYALAAAGPAGWRRLAGAALAALAVAAWTGAVFLAPAHGLVDGRSLLQLGDAREKWLNGLAYASVFAVAWALAAWRPAPVRNFLVALFALQAMQTAWIAMHDPKPWRAPPDVERFAHLSTERNVLVVLLDAFQSDLFAQIADGDPALRDAFQGFTYFPAAVSHAPTTYLSMPAIHTGVAPVDGRGLRALYEPRVVNESFVAKLAVNGWDAVLVNPILQACPRGTECYLPEEVVHGLGGTLREYALFMVDLAVFRMAPVAARHWIYRDGDWLSPTGFWGRQQSTANALLDRFARDAHGGNPRPAVRFMHLFSTHPPARLGEDCGPVGLRPWNRGNALVHDRCAVRSVARILEALRRRGLYDRTAIVVLADHGALLPFPDGRSFPLGASASPLLLVKPLDAHGPMAVSPATVGLLDVAATVCAQAAACRAEGGSDLLAPRHGPVSYPFLQYQWEASFFAVDEVRIANRFLVEGPPGDLASWHRETHVPDAPLEHVSFDAHDSPAAMGLGWSGVERREGDDGRWAEARSADVYVYQPDAAAARLVLDVSGPPQNVGVWVDGTQVGAFESSVERRVHEVAIPAGVARRGVERIVFRFNADGRSVFFHDLAVARAR